MKDDILVKEGGTVPTLSDTMETKEKKFLKKLQLGSFLRPAEETGPHRSVEFAAVRFYVSGFILIPVG